MSAIWTGVTAAPVPLALCGAAASSARPPEAALAPDTVPSPPSLAWLMSFLQSEALSVKRWASGFGSQRLTPNAQRSHDWPIVTLRGRAHAALDAVAFVAVDAVDVPVVRVGHDEGVPVTGWAAFHHADAAGHRPRQEQPLLSIPVVERRGAAGFRHAAAQVQLAGGLVHPEYRERA